MALNVEPQRLIEEVGMAERLREVHHKAIKGLIDRYVGNNYRSDRGKSSQHENHVYEYLALNVPRLVFDDPKIMVNASQDDPMSVAEVMELGINQWVKDVHLRKMLQLMAYDFLLGFGITITRLEPMPGVAPRDDDWTPMRPSIVRLPPGRFFIDPYALEFDQARFMGHLAVEDKDDLLKLARENPDSGWNAEVIESLAADEGIDKLDRDRQVEGNRNELVYYEIWVPEHQLDDAPGPEEGFHGTIFTLALSNAKSGDGARKSDFIRDPRPYYGPRTGPYTMFGCYPVPDSPYPLSPLVATMQQADDLNDNAEAVQRANQQYKRLVLVDSSNPALAQSLKSNPDLFVMPINGLQKDQVIQIEVGGASQYQMEQLKMLRERLDRNSGVQEMHRGNLTKATAAEVGVAEGAHQERLAFVQQRFGDSTTDAIKAAAWYMYADNRVVFDLAMQGVAGQFYGGVHEGQSLSGFYGLTFDIESMSMERNSQSLLQRRVHGITELILQAAPLIPNTPWVDWDMLFDMHGDANNIRDLNQIINMDVVNQVVQAQQAQAMGAGGVPMQSAGAEMGQQMGLAMAG